MFRGSHEAKIDDKGRLKVPSAFKALMDAANVTQFFVTSTNGKWAVGNLSGGDWALGQSPLRSPSVFNFFRPGYVPPHTALAEAELVAPEFQIHNESTTASYINFMSQSIKTPRMTARKI